MLKSKAEAVPYHDDYQAQDDMHTLMRAHEIKSNPKRHAAAKAHAKKKLAGMKAVVAGDKKATVPY